MQVLPAYAERKRWHALSSLPGWEVLRDRAVQWALEPVPSYPSEYWDSDELWEPDGGVTRARRERLRLFALAEAIEGSGRFMTALEAEIRAMLQEPSWIAKPHDKSGKIFRGLVPGIDLQAADRALTLATVCQIYQNVFPEALTIEIRAALRNRIVDPFLHEVREEGGISSGFWWLESTNNWNAVMHSRIIGTGLQLLSEPRERADLIAAMEVYLPRYLEGFSDDGYCSEGIGYWNYGFGAFVDLSVALSAQTNGEICLLDDAKARSVAAYPAHFALFPGIYPPFSDADFGVSPSMATLALMPPAIDPQVYKAGYLRENLINQPLFRLGLLLSSDAIGGEQKETAEESLPSRDFFPEAGVFIWREKENSTEKGDRVCRALAAKAGNNGELHNHNDIGTFVYNFGPVALLSDPGRESYSAQTFSSSRYERAVLSSYGHSLPVINGRLQGTGPEFHGEVIEYETGEVRDFARLDLTGAYSDESLRKLLRSFDFDRGCARVLEVADSVEFSSPGRFETALITFGDVDVLGGDGWLISMGDHAVKVEVDTSGVAFQLREEALDVDLPSGAIPSRLSVVMCEPIRTARIRFIISPARSNERIAGDSGWGSRASFIRLQAETFHCESGGEAIVAAKVGSEAGAVTGWYEEGHRLTWTFRVHQEGDYGLVARYCHPGPAESSRTVVLDGMELDSLLRLPPSGGWSQEIDNWAEREWSDAGKLEVFRLAEGEHELSLDANDTGLALDWIELRPLTPAN
jgi:hypothetical protein